MCIQCYGKKKHILIQGIGINDDFSCFVKGVEEKWQASVNIFPGMSNFQNQLCKHSKGEWGANNSVSALPALPSAAPSKLPAEMMVWGCLCPAVMSLHLQPPCWENAAAWLPAGNVGLRAGLELPV